MVCDDAAQKTSRGRNSPKAAVRYVPDPTVAAAAPPTQSNRKINSPANSTGVTYSSETFPTNVPQASRITSSVPVAPRRSTSVPEHSRETSARGHRTGDLMHPIGTEDVQKHPGSTYIPGKSRRAKSPDIERDHNVYLKQGLSGTGDLYQDLGQAYDTGRYEDISPPAITDVPKTVFVTAARSPTDSPWHGNQSDRTRTPGRINRAFSADTERPRVDPGHRRGVHTITGDAIQGQVHPTDVIGGTFDSGEMYEDIET